MSASEKTPLTQSTFYLYWIAVDKTKHRSGAGRKLLRSAEEEVAPRGGKLLLAETSSMEAYGGSIAFYEKTGYELVAKIVEYYKPGDDKLIFAKTLPAPTQRELMAVGDCVPMRAGTPYGKTLLAVRFLLTA